MSQAGSTSSEQQAGLGRGLKRRHLSMISLGGIIGAGLFVGSGSAIAEVGPAVLVCYVLVGLLIVFVMRMLGEMAAAQPETGSFSAYAERVFGPWAGFTIGWLYWSFWVVVLAVETTAAAVIVHQWVPAIPQWLLALAFIVVLTLTNLVSVAGYGEFEFWFAGIKVAAIVAFIVLGALAIFGFLPGVEPVGMSNLTGRGGFFPHGVTAVVNGMLLMIFSFVGAEIVTIAAAESKDPSRAVRRATNSVVWRISLFYIGSIAVVVTLVPWDSPAVAEGPYVAVLEALGLPAAGVVMNAVVLTAVLSCTNSGLYTASRMVYSLARRGQAPAACGRTTAKGVPRAAILVSLIAGYVAVIFNFVSPDLVFQFLLNASSCFALFAYIGIACTQLVMRWRLERSGQARTLQVRMWGFPVLTLLSIASMLAIAVAMVFDAEVRSQILLSSAATAVVVTVSLVWQRRQTHRGTLAGGEPVPAGDTGVASS